MADIPDIFYRADIPYIFWVNTRCWDPAYVADKIQSTTLGVGVVCGVGWVEGSNAV